MEENKGVQKIKEKLAKIERQDKEKFFRENRIYEKVPTTNNVKQDDCLVLYEDDKKNYYTRKYPELTEKEYSELRNRVSKSEITEFNDSFDSYKLLPTILMFIVVIASVILAFIDAFVGFTNMCYVWIFGGVVFGAVTYGVTKCLIAPIILQTKYLEIIIRKLEEDDK